MTLEYCNDKNVPELRFQGFDGEWEEKKLGEISETKTGNSNREDSETEGEYIFFDRSVDIRRSNNFLFDSEAIIVPGEGSDFKPRFFEGKFDLHQRTYATMKFEGSSIFLYYSMYKNRYHFLKYAVGSTVKSLRLPIFNNMPINLPTLPEQQKIANFLTTLDNKIENLKKQEKLLKTLKKGFLQKLFPQTGKLVPELRFPGFVGEWEEKGFLEASKIIKSGIRPFENFKDYLSTSSVKDSQIVSIEGKITYNNRPSRANMQPKINSVWFAKMKDTRKFLVFKDSKDIKEYVLSTGFLGLDPKENLSLDFLYLLIRTPEFEVQKNKLSKGNTQQAINNDSLSQIKIKLPSLPEQQKIADFLTALDNKIEGLSQNIEKTNRLKKGFLQKVLV